MIVKPDRDQAKRIFFAGWGRFDRSQPFDEARAEREFNDWWSVYFIPFYEPGLAERVTITAQEILSKLSDTA